MNDELNDTSKQKLTNMERLASRTDQLVDRLDNWMDDE